MTLTNHVRRIQELAEAVITLCDSRKYEESHCALDDIEVRARCLHRHIDNLQLKADCAARPAGDVPK